MGTSDDASATDTGSPGDDRAAARERLRARGRRRRAALSRAAREEAATAVAATLLSLPIVVAADRVLLTRAVGDELDLRPLEDALRAAGTTVALPVVDGPGLLVVDTTARTATRPGWHGVEEPVGPPTDAPVDVVVVPALVLSRRGDRLGYGGGHFDRFLAGRTATVAIGAVFETQVVDAVPTEPHDVRLDLVVTEAGAWRDGRRVD